MRTARRSTLRGTAAIGVALFVVAGCGDTNAPTTGALDVIVTTTGGDLDLDGYLVTVDGAAPQPVAVNEQVAMSGLAAGPHDVELSGVANNCTVTGGTIRSVTVIGGETTEIAFAVSCVATGVQVTIATSGVDLDPDGYAVSVDGAPPLAVPVNGSVSITRLTAGSHTVTLSGVVANCAASGTNPRSVVVAAGEVVSVGFPVTCLATTGSVAVNAVTSGLDLDPNGYTVQVDNGAPRTLAVNATTVFEGLSAGDHSVTLAGAAANCSVAGNNPQTVPVNTGGVTRDTARTTFQVSCVALTGVVEVTTLTSGVNLDQNGYMVQLDGGGSQQVPVNGTVRFTGVSGGDHQVALVDAAPNCPVSGENPRTLSVTTGGLTRDTARTTFEVVCEPTTGTARIITATSGADFDQNGYFMGVDCDTYYGCYYSYHAEQMSVNDTVTLSGVPSGPHTFQLDDVAVNCSVGGASPRTVHVAGGTTTDIVFPVTCAAFGSIQVTTTTTGVDFDANGYRITADGTSLDATRDVAVNGTETISGLLAGAYVVTLGGLAVNCDVTSPSPVTVTVPSGGTAVVTFSAACAQASQLAVAHTVNGNTDVYVVKSNGADLTQLTTDAAYDADPAWSRDGTQIAFASERDGGNRDIYVMNANGTGLARLTTAAGQDYHPTWSSNSTKIAFLSQRDGNFEIYVMNADGTSQERLTTNEATDADPAWSPDGTKIAFWSNRDGNGEIYVMNPDGSGVTRLTNNAVDDVQPEWSPDGTQVVFSRLTGCESYSGFCDYDLYVMNANGSGVAQLTSGSSDNDAVWSPDGRWVAFGASFCQPYYYSCYFSYNAVHLVRADGTRLVELLRDAIHPAWRP